MTEAKGMTYGALACLMIAATLGIFGFTLGAVVTGEWRWLFGTAACFAIVRPLFPR